MKYFMTGATGFIGGQVARQLAADGHEVRALVRSPGKAQGLAEAGINLVIGDITDRETLRAPMTGVDGVFHIAGWYKLGAHDTSAAQAINVDGTRNVLEMMRELAVPKGIYTSTLAVFSDTHGQAVNESYRYDGPHISEYDRTKWVAHYEIAQPMMKAGLPLVIVQPGLVYGPGDTSSVREAFLQYLRRKLPIAPQRSAFCWAHVDDIAQGHILALDKGRVGESYILAGPAHTFIEAIAVAECITGIPAPRLRPSPGMMKASAALMSLIEKVVPVPEMFTSEYLRINAGVTYIASSDKARRELGFAPRSLEDGLRQTLSYEMEQLASKTTLA